MGDKHTHPKRTIETSLGNLISDIFAENARCDVMLTGSGSIRIESLGPVVRLQDLLSCFPYDDTLTKYTITGSQLTSVFAHIMRNENRNDEGECYQVNSGVEAVFDTKKDSLISLKLKGEKVIPDQEYTICLQSYHFKQSATNLNLTNEELLANENHRVVATSAQEVLEENFRNMQNQTRKVEGRLVYK